MSAFTPSASYYTQEPIRSLIDSLLGGTAVMRINSAKYLPKNTAETADDYNIRVENTHLYNQFGRTVSAATGKVLAKPVVVNGSTPEIDVWQEDFDLEGGNLDNFVKVWFADAIAHGVSFAVADMPKSNTDPALRTKASDAAEGIRAYGVHVPCRNLISWQIERIGGVRTITQVVFREDAYIQDPNNPYGQRFVERVRVLRPGSWQLIQKNLVYNEKTKTNDEVEIVIDEGVTNLSYIPLVAAYANTKIAPLEAKPPLQNLAELNVRHWQSSSDQNNILRIARVPILHIARSTTLDEAGNAASPDEWSIGGNQAIETGPEDKIKFVEHTGAAITSGRQDLQDLLDMMDQVSFQLVARDTSGDVTATETSVMSAEANAFLTSISEQFKDAVELLLLYMCDMQGLDAKPEVFIHKEFGNIQVATDMPLLLQMFKDGIIDQPTVIDGAKRRGLLPEDTKAEEVKGVPQDTTSTITTANPADPAITG